MISKIPNFAFTECRFDDIRNQNVLIIRGKILNLDVSFNITGSDIEKIEDEIHEFVKKYIQQKINKLQESITPAPDRRIRLGDEDDDEDSLEDSDEI